MASRHPTVKWAQRHDKVYITIELPDAKDVKFKLEPEGKFFFSATSGVDNIPYEIDMDLYEKVDVNVSDMSFDSDCLDGENVGFINIVITGEHG